MTENLEGANVLELSEMLAGSTGLEPAASGVTGRRSNQLNYDPETIRLCGGPLRRAVPRHPAHGVGWWAVQDSNL